MGSCKNYIKNYCDGTLPGRICCVEAHVRHPDHLVLALQKPRLRLGVVKAVLLVLGPRHVGHEGGHVAASLVQIHRRALRPLGVHAVVGGNVRKTPVTFYLASNFFFNIFRTEQATLDPREYAKKEK